MNKHEAIERIKNIETLNIKDSIADKGVDMVIKKQVIDLISQIDEPQKVGVLMIDVPEPSAWKYTYVKLDDYRGRFSIEGTTVVGMVSAFAYKCTQEEAKKYPQCRWVALEELG